MAIQNPRTDINKYFNSLSMSGTVLGTENSTMNKVYNRNGYIIRRAQCKRKCRTLRSNFKVATEEASMGTF